MPGQRIGSVLDGLTKADVIRTPFPHLLLRDALDAGPCERLVKEFPSLEAMTGLSSHPSNRRYSFRACEVIEDERVSPLWRTLLRTHVSAEFFRQVMGLFEDDIRALDLPGLREPAELVPGVRGVNTPDDSGVRLDAQISMNSPVHGEASSVRGGHLDDPHKLYFGLLYLRPPGDDSRGGELELYRYRTGAPPAAFRRREIEGRYLEAVARVPYERNVLVFGLNSLHSLHGVTARSVCGFQRQFLNLVGEVNAPLFSLDTLQEPPRPRGLFARALDRWRGPKTSPQEAGRRPPCARP